jgi:hypothetical protein
VQPAKKSPSGGLTLTLRSAGCEAAFLSIFCAMKIDGEPDVRKLNIEREKYGRDLVHEKKFCAN